MGGEKHQSATDRTPESGDRVILPYNIGPGKCFPSTFYKRINAGDRGACEAIRWWIKDGGRDCRIRSNNCYGQVSRRDQESALACWGSTDKQNILLKNDVDQRDGNTNPANWQNLSE